MLPLDLHVLSLSLAFILSQDQTLRCNYFYFLFFPFFSGHLRSTKASWRLDFLKPALYLLYYYYPFILSKNSFICRFIDSVTRVWLPCRKRVQKYCGFLYPPNIFATFLKKISSLLKPLIFRYLSQFFISHSSQPLSAACYPSFFLERAAKIRSFISPLQIFLQLFLKKIINRCCSNPYKILKSGSSSKLRSNPRYMKSTAQAHNWKQYARKRRENSQFHRKSKKKPKIKVVFYINYYLCFVDEEKHIFPNTKTPFSQNSK